MKKAQPFLKTVPQNAILSPLRSIFPVSTGSFRYRYSWLFGTRLATALGFRTPHTILHGEYHKPNTTLTLGSVLLDDLTSKNKSQFGLFHFLKTIRSNSSPTPRPLHVIQVFEDFEKDESLPLTGNLKAISNPDTDKNIFVHRLTLVDFTHDMRPDQTFSTAFLQIFKTLQSNPCDIYVHCKAGVNRSFRVSTALRTLFELTDSAEKQSSLTLIEVIKAVIKNCEAVKKQRSCVSFHSDNQFEQIGFIAHLVLKGFNKEGLIPVNDQEMKKAISIAILSLYIDHRTKKDTYNASSFLKKLSVSLFASSFQHALEGLSKESKISAANKFIKDLNGESVDYTESELIALNQGSLAAQLTLIEKSYGLPTYFKKQNIFTSDFKSLVHS